MCDILNKKLRVIDIIDGTIVDGPGLRTSIYLAGCRHACPGCHNPQSWDFGAGNDMSISEIIRHVESNGFNITLSGGDPFYQADNVLLLCKELHKMGINIWIYTGFTYEQIIGDEKMSKVLDFADVLVDGPYINAMRDVTLRFRGSSNQRIIDLRSSKIEHVVEWN